MQLLLIRHGQTPANVRGEIATRAPGGGLTPLGEQQAAALPAALADREIGGIFVSSLVRTHLTAAPLAAERDLRPVQLDGLAEVEAGDLEDRSDQAAVDEFHDTFCSWASGHTSAAPPGAPDGVAFLARFDEAVRRILDSAGTTGTAVAISHGAAIRAWAGTRAGNLDATFVRTNRIGNTALVEVHGDFETGWTCVAWSSDPLGGVDLADRSAADPTGESAPAEQDVHS